MSGSDHRRTADSVPGRGHRRRRSVVAERIAHWTLRLCVVLSVLTTAGIVVALAGDAAVFFSRVPATEFLTGTRWSPTIKPVAFGVLPLVSGTLAITFGAAVIALPAGLATAIYLSEYASERSRSVLKPALEMLAGIPTIVYGYFALVYVTPALGAVIPSLSTFNALSGSLVVGVMILPIVSSVSEDAIGAVPDQLRHAGYALGSTRFEVSTRIVVPAAASGITSAFVLALSRAIGETMAVVVAAGMRPRLVNPLLPETYADSIQTMTAAMVQLGASDVSGNSTAYRSLFAIGLTLFAVTLSMNLASHVVARRYREVYE